MSLWVLAHIYHKDCGARGEERQCDDASLHSEMFGHEYRERTTTGTEPASMVATATTVVRRTWTTIIATIVMTFSGFVSCSPA